MGETIKLLVGKNITEILVGKEIKIELKSKIKGYKDMVIYGNINKEGILKPTKIVNGDLKQIPLIIFGEGIDYFENEIMCYIQE